MSTNGDNGKLLDVADFNGRVHLPQRTTPQGLAALELDPYRDVALVYFPGAPVDVNQAVITHCENLKFRFAVVDPDRSVTSNFQPCRAICDTRYAALYYPWTQISDPETGARKIVPPGGHVLGVYARSDAERGWS